MILNENTASHPFYQPNARVRTPKQVRPHSGLATGDCPGHPEGRFEWMRRRQAWKRELKGGLPLNRRTPNAVRI